MKHLLFATALIALWFLMATNHGKAGEAVGFAVLLILFAVV
jgi:hypothetical protein